MSFSNRLHLLRIRQDRHSSDALQKRFWRRIGELENSVHVLFSATAMNDGVSEHIRIYFHPDSNYEPELTEFEVDHTSFWITDRNPLIPYEVCGVTDTLPPTASVNIWRFEESDFSSSTGYTIAVYIYPRDAAESILPEFRMGLVNPITAQEFREAVSQMFAPLKLPNLIDLSWVVEACFASVDGFILQGGNSDYGVIVRQDYQD